MGDNMAGLQSTPPFDQDLTRKRLTLPEAIEVVLRTSGDETTGLPGAELVLWIRRPLPGQQSAESKWDSLRKAVATLRNGGTSPVPLRFDADDLPLHEATPSSRLALLGHEVLLPTACLARNLTINALVRLQSANERRIEATLLQGSIRLEGLDTERPNLLEARPDFLADLWPETGSVLTKILIGARNLQIQVQRKIDDGKVQRLQLLRLLADGSRLWQLVACPDEPGATDPATALNALVTKLQNAAAGMPIRFTQTGGDNQGVFFLATARSRTTLLDTIDPNTTPTPTEIRTVVAQNNLDVTPVPVLLAPDTRFEELVHVQTTEPNVDGGYLYNLDRPVRYPHQANDPIAFFPQGSVRAFYRPDLALHLTNDDKSITTWLPHVLSIEKRIEGVDLYRFTDADSDDLVPTEVPVSDDRLPVLVGWESSGGAVQTQFWNLPTTYLTAAAQTVPQGSGYLWQFSPLEQAGQPALPCWLRYRRIELAGLPPKPQSPPQSIPSLERLAGLTKSLKLLPQKPSDWQLEVDVPTDDTLTEHLRIIVALTADSGSPQMLRIQVGVVKPWLELRSPQVMLWAGDQLPQPASMPPAKQLTNGGNVDSEGWLVFRAGVPLGVSQPVFAQFDFAANDFLLNADEDDALVFTPLPRAVVQSVSPAKNNLGVSIDPDSSRLIRERDPSHGLVGRPLLSFHLSASPTGARIAQPLFYLPTVVPPPPAATLALLPWVEWIYGATDDKQFVPHHRNLILEAAEYDAAGPFLSTVGQAVAVPDNVAADYFRQVVRDRCTAASEPVPADQPSPVRNWLPGVVLTTQGNPWRPTLKVSLSDPGGPALILHTPADTDQRLDLASSARPQTRWLDYAVRWTSSSGSTPPAMELLPASSPDLPKVTRAGVPLLFELQQVEYVAATDRHLAAVARNGSGAWRAIVWDVLAPVAAPLAVSLSAEVSCLALASEEKLLLVGDINGRVSAWDFSNTPVQAHWQVQPLPAGQAVTRLATAPGTQAVVVAGTDNRVLLLHIQDGTTERTFALPEAPVLSVAVFSKTDGLRIFAAGGTANGDFRIWQRTGDIAWQAQSPGQPFQAVALDNEGLLAVAAVANQIQAWLVGKANPLGAAQPVGQNSGTVRALVSRRALTLTATAPPSTVTWVMAWTDNAQQPLWVAPYPDASGVATFAALPAVADENWTAVALGSADTGAVVWAGAASGILRSWDPTTGVVVGRRRAEGTFVYDNLGVIRRSSVSRGTSWQIATVDVPVAADANPPTYQTVRLLSGEAILAEFGSDATLDRTEIRFRCDALALAADGTTLSADTCGEQGVYGYWAGTDPKDAWQRLLGLPILATSLDHVELDAGGNVTAVTFSAVVPSPPELPVKPVKPKSSPVSVEQGVPEFVRRALAQSSVLTIVCKVPAASAADLQISGQIVWPLPEETAPLFPLQSYSARLAEVTGSVTVAGGRLQVSLTEAAFEVFGRLWRQTWQNTDTPPRLSGFGGAQGHRFLTTGPVDRFASSVQLAVPPLALAGARTLLSVWALTGYSDGSVILTDAVTGFVLADKTPLSTSAITAVAIRLSEEDSQNVPDPRRRTAVALASDAQGKLWSVTFSPSLTQQTQFTLPESSPATSLDRVDNGALAAAGKHALYFYLGKESLPNVEYQGHTDTVLAIRGGSWNGSPGVVTGCADGNVRVFVQNQATAILTLPFDSQTEIAVPAVGLWQGSDGTAYVVAAGVSGAVKLWKSDTAIPIATFNASVTDLVEVGMEIVAGTPAVIAVSRESGVFAWDSATGVSLLQIPWNAGASGLWAWIAAIPTQVAQSAGDMVAFADFPRLLMADVTGTLRQAVLANSIEITDSRDLPGRMSVCHLPVPLPDHLAPPLQLQAVALPGNRLSLSIGQSGSLRPAFAALLQGFAYGFLLDPNGDWSLGHEVAFLWTEGSLQKPQLGGLFLTETRDKQAIPLEDGPAGLAGFRTQLELWASQLVPAQVGPTTLAWSHHIFAAWQATGTQGTSDAVTLLIPEQVFFHQPSSGAAPNLPLTCMLWFDMGSSHFQAPIRMNVVPPQIDPTTGQQTDNGKVQFVPGIYRGVQVKPPPADSTWEVVYPGKDTASLAAYSAQLSVATGKAQDCYLLVALDPQNNQFVVRSLDAHWIPLDVCLDQDLTVAQPLLPSAIPQLIHRRSDGSQLRVDLANGVSFYELPAEVLQAAAPASPTTLSGYWLLWPLCQFTDRLSWLQQTVFAQAIPPPSGDKFRGTQTENILVLYRQPGFSPPDAGQDDSGLTGRDVPLMSILNVTGTKPDSGEFLVTERQIQDQVQRTGASGLVVRRVLQEENFAKFQIIASPFYAGLGELALAGQSASAPVALAALSLLDAPHAEPSAMLAASSDWDPRNRLPQDMLSWVLGSGPAYRLATPEVVEDDWERAAAFKLEAPAQATTDRLLLRLEETPDFDPPLRHWPGPTPPPETTVVDTFLPQQWAIYYAPDKPGAMIHHRVQPLQANATDMSAPVAVGPAIAYALRDPLRLLPPADAAVTVTSASLHSNTLTDNLFDLSFAWQEQLGKLSKESLALADTIRVHYDSSADAFDLVLTSSQERPLALATLVNDQLLAVTSESADLPLNIAQNTGVPFLVLMARVDLLTPLLADDPSQSSFKPMVRVQATVTIPPLDLSILFPPPSATGGGLSVWYLGSQTQVPNLDWSAVTNLEIYWYAEQTATRPAAELLALALPVRIVPISSLSSRMYTVLSIRGGSALYERTVLFGEAAPSLDGVTRPTDDGGLECVRQDADVVSLAMPSPLGMTVLLDLVKVLADGKVVAAQQAVAVT